MSRYLRPRVAPWPPIRIREDRGHRLEHVTIDDHRPRGVGDHLPAVGPQPGVARVNQQLADLRATPLIPRLVVIPLVFHSVAIECSDAPARTAV